MTKVLITGSAGFIGSNLVRYLLDGTAWEIIGLDSLYTKENLKVCNLQDCGISKPGLIYGTESISQDRRYRFFLGDVTDEFSCRQIIHKHKPNFVIHLAAVQGRLRSENRPEEATKTNIFGFENILRISKEEGVEKFLYASDFSVYDPRDEEYIRKELDMSEDDFIEVPGSYYGLSKYMNELQARRLAEGEGNEMRCTGLRIFSTYGPRMNPDSLIYKFSKALLEDKEIVINGYKDISRDWIYVKDVCGYIYTILTWTQIEKHAVFNIGSGEDKTLQELISTLQDLENKKFRRVIYSKESELEIYHTKADTEKLDLCLGSRPLVSLEEGLDKFLVWLKENDQKRQGIEANRNSRPAKGPYIDDTIHYLNYTGQEACIYHFQGKSSEDLLNEVSYALSKKVLKGFPEDLSIITTYTDPQKSPLIRQLRISQIPYINSAEELMVKGLPFSRPGKIYLLKDALQEIKTKYCLILDGYDVVINNFDDIIKKFQSYHTQILFNASKNNYPPVHIDRIPERDYIGAFRFFNAGCCIGETEALEKFYTQAALLEPALKEFNTKDSEQYVLRHVFAENSETSISGAWKYVTIDYKCIVFQTTGNAEIKEFLDYKYIIT